jgi:hypothetical protein
MAVRLSALGAGSPLPPGRFLVLIYVSGWVDPRAIVRLEGLGQLNKSNYLNRNGTRDLPACSVWLNQLRYRALPLNHILEWINTTLPEPEGTTPQIPKPIIEYDRVYLSSNCLGYRLLLQDKSHIIRCKIFVQNLYKIYMIRWTVSVQNFLYHLYLGIFMTYYIVFFVNVLLQLRPHSYLVHIWCTLYFRNLVPGQGIKHETLLTCTGRSTLADCDASTIQAFHGS